MKNRGFTLIELMIVVAIMSILMSIVTSNLKTARAKAQIIGCGQNVKTIGSALELYANRHGNYHGAWNTEDGVISKPDGSMYAQVQKQFEQTQAYREGFLKRWPRCTLDDNKTPGRTICIRHWSENPKGVDCDIYHYGHPHDNEIRGFFTATGGDFENWPGSMTLIEDTCEGMSSEGQAIGRPIYGWHFYNKNGDFVPAAFELEGWK